MVIDDIAPHLDYYEKSKYEIFSPDSNKSVKLSPTNKSINHVKVRYPSDYDLDNYPHLSLTSEDNWDPNETTSDEISAITLYSDNLYHCLISNVDISAILHTKYHKEITKESLAELWGIGIDAAKRTIDVSTQNTLRVTNGDLHRRFQTKAHQQQYNQLSGIYASYCTDTAITKIKSIRGNTCAQIFTNTANHTVCYPMKSKGEAHLALSNFFHDISVPNILHSHNAKEFTAGLQENSETNAINIPLNRHS